MASKPTSANNNKKQARSGFHCHVFCAHAGNISSQPSENAVLWSEMTVGAVSLPSWKKYSCKRLSQKLSYLTLFLPPSTMLFCARARRGLVRRRRWRLFASVVREADVGPIHQVPIVEPLAAFHAVPTVLARALVGVPIRYADAANVCPPRQISMKSGATSNKHSFGATFPVHSKRLRHCVVYGSFLPPSVKSTVGRLS